MTFSWFIAMIATHIIVICLAYLLGRHKGRYAGWVLKSVFIELIESARDLNSAPGDARAWSRLNRAVNNGVEVKNELWRAEAAVVGAALTEHAARKRRRGETL